jgi:hypothetical protein
VLHRPFFRSAASLALAILLAAALAPPLSAAPTAAAAVERFFPAANHDPAVPTPRSLLGFDLGDRAATHAEIDRCLQAWAAASPRLRLLTHGKTWEGRTLYHLAISSPENIARLDAIRDGWQRVADPRRTAAGESERLATELPAVAWLAYSIHGDEVSPADAALAVAYRLAAGTDADVTALLRDLVVIIDPVQNPDGRDRFLARVAETRGAVPNRDDQAIQQRGSWPWGRTNHYLFDLNRDWTLATQPESQGRLRALAEWHPLFFLDVHEMELANQTFLFYPPRPPINPYLPATTPHWWDVFGAAEAHAFDQHGWRYYTGEWADWWYPGYSDSLSSFRGAVGILHEQAGITAGSVRMENGQLLSYAESVDHQVTATFADLGALAANRLAVARDFAANRRRALAVDGPTAGRTLAIVPDGNGSRLDRFVGVLRLHGAELGRLDRELTVTARDAFGRRGEHRLPAGTVLVSGQQPEGALLRAMLDFDLPIPDAVLAKERKALLTGADTLLYDITGWSLPLLYGLDAYEVDGRVAGGQPWDDAARPAVAVAPAPSSVAWVIDGADDAALPAAVRLLDGGWRVRVADEAFALDGSTFARGSLVVNRDDNRARGDELGAAVAAVANELHLAVHGVGTGLGAGDLADLGGQHFLLLTAPRVALVGVGSAEVTSFGALWQELDRELGAHVSMLEAGDPGTVDLRRYNVIVVAPGSELAEPATKALHAWVESGGTLIASEDAAGALAAKESEVTAARTLPDVLGELADYRADLLAGWAELAEADRASTVRAAATRQTAVSSVDRPWQGLGEDDASEDELARRDAFAARFMPQGAILAARVDPAHWLTSGVGERLPVFVGDVPVLMAKAPVEAPVRLGVLSAPEAPAADQTPSTRGVAAPAPPFAWQPLGWSAVPAGRELTLRLSGLLWPEAAERLANAAYLTRERVGAGQVILFAGNPVYRGTTRGTARLFGNAVVLGPGCGTERLVVP